MSATIEAPPRRSARPKPEAPDAASTPEAPMGLWRKIAYVQQHATTVEKTGEVAFKSTRFRHMQEHGLLHVLKPLCAEVGLAVTSNVAGWSADGNTYFIDFQLIVTDIDTGEQTVATYPNCGVDSADKGFNKALTGANKYALQKFFAVPTDDIDDNETVDQKSERSQARAGSRAGVAASAPATISGTELQTIRETTAKAVQDGHLTSDQVKQHLVATWGVQRIDALNHDQATAFSEWLIAQVTK